MTASVQQHITTKSKDKNGRSFNLRTTSKFSEYFKLKGDTKALAKKLDIEKRIGDDEEIIL